eukprot:gene2359-2720_t
MKKRDNQPLPLRNGDERGKHEQQQAPVSVLRNIQMVKKNPVLRYLQRAKRKIRARNGHKLVVKNTIAKVYGLLPPAGRVADIEVQTKLESYKNTLERKRKDIETLDADIINALEKDDDIEKDILDREEFEEEVSETICRIQNILKARTESPHRINWESQSRKEAQVKLPKLNMLTFNGDPTQWISFSESFKSSIDGNQNLAKVEKMKYLQGLQSGPAAETIKGLSLSEENYDEAFELLKRRFGNKQIIISKHIENIMEMPKVTSLFEQKKFRLLFDKTETAVRSSKKKYWNFNRKLWYSSFSSYHVKDSERATLNYQSKNL